MYCCNFFNFQHNNIPLYDGFQPQHPAVISIIHKDILQIYRLGNFHRDPNDCPDRPGSAQAWEDFKRRLNKWRELKWTNTGFVKSVVFLDLTIKINDKRELEFFNYRKPMNLSLYLPPNSSHSPDVLRSIIFGPVRAYFLHCTYNKYFVDCIDIEKPGCSLGRAVVSLEIQILSIYR